MNRFFLFIILLCSTLSMATANDNLSPTDANIVGHVLNKATGEHLPYVKVSLKGTTIMTTTDKSGHYFLKNLPEGKFNLVFSYLGFKPVTKSIYTAKGKTLEINVELQEEEISLDGVVVSANRAETSRRLAPTLVNVLDNKIFVAANAINLSQGLNYQPGVRVETNCQNCGFQQVRINGLEGPYTQILIDSRPVFSALAGVYGLEQIPANMIERVEVMRGGGSALFGSSAIAGTINIITKEPLHNSGQLTHNISSIGGSSAFDNNTTMNASLVTDDNKAGLYVFGQSRHRSGYDHDHDGFTELPKLENQTAGFRSYLRTSDYTKLTFEYHHMHEFRRGGDSLHLPPHEANIAEQVEHNIDGGGLRFDFYSPDLKHRLNVFTSAQSINRKSYYGAQKNPNAYGKTKDFTFLAGTQYTYGFNKCLFMPADLTVGFEYNYDRLEDHMLGYHREIDQKVRIGSLFLQNEWKNEKWSVLIGGRLDKHNMIDHVIFSPRANLRFNPTPDINLRMSYSAGFRAPQAFDEDLHINAVGGEIVMIQRNKDLSEEKSHSLSASVDFYHRFNNGIQLNLMLEGFYTSLNDVFRLEPVGKNENGIVIKERRNGSGAKVMGVNVEGKIAFNKWVSVQGGVTWQQSRYKDPYTWSEDNTIAPTKKMFRTPDFYGYFTANVNPVKNLTFSLSGTYTGHMFVQHMAGYIEKDECVKTPDFFEMNSKLAYEFPIYKAIRLEVNGGVQNIFNAYQKDFDLGPDRDSSYIYGPATPRSYFAGVKVSF